MVTVRLPEEIDVANVAGAGLDLAAALRDGPAVVIADLTGTRFIGAAGAGMLAGAHRDAAEAGGHLRIAASAPVRRVLAITGLDQHLAVYPSLAAAQAAAANSPTACRTGPSRPRPSLCASSATTSPPSSPKPATP